MPSTIDEHAFLSDLQSAALVGIDGDVDWFAAPRFDSPACFAALLGDERHGHWTMAPVEPVIEVRRCYRPGTLVLDREVRTASGAVRISECMPLRDDGRVLVITPQEKGFEGDPTHVRFFDDAACRALADALDLRIESSYSFPFPRAVGRVFRYNEFVFVLRPR